MKFKDILINTYFVCAGGVIGGIVVSFATGASIQQNLQMILFVFGIAYIIVLSIAILMSKLLDKVLTNEK